MTNWKEIAIKGAEQAYRSEIIDTDSKDTIGKNKEYASKQDWIETKLMEWGAKESYFDVKEDKCDCGGDIFRTCQDCGDIVD
jgi:hypothetical protein